MIFFCECSIQVEVFSEILLTFWGIQIIRDTKVLNETFLSFFKLWWELVVLILGRSSSWYGEGKTRAQRKWSGRIRKWLILILYCLMPLIWNTYLCLKTWTIKDGSWWQWRTQNFLEGGAWHNMPKILTPTCYTFDSSTA